VQADALTERSDLAYALPR